MLGGPNVSVNSLLQQQSVCSPDQTLMPLFLSPAGICKSEGSCVQVWAPWFKDKQHQIRASRHLEMTE